jgi:hypothetical protein
MALIKDYEIPGTGVTVPNAYHVVTNIKIEKRIADIKPPVDSSRPSGYTVRDESPGTEVYWKKGYTAEIAVTVWKDKAARENEAKPIGQIGVNPTDNLYGASVGTPGLDHRCKFFLEVPSELSDLEQAYRHLLTLDYYSGSLED